MADDKQTFKPGKYTVSAQGHNGTFPMDVTFTADRLESIDIDQKTETAGISDVVYDRIPTAIVNGQTLNVDAVTGASETSRGILNGVAEAVTKAGGDAKEWQNRNKYTPKVATNSDLQTDVVIIGGGGAGLAAAATVLDQGRKVVLLEKAPALGGNTIRTGGPMNAADPEWQNTFDALPGEHQTLQDLLDMDVDDIDPEYQHDFKTLQSQIKAYFADTKNQKAYLFDSAELHRIQTYLGGTRTDLNGDRIYGNYKLVKTLTDNDLAAQKWLAKIGVKFDTSDVAMPVGALWRRGHKPVKNAGYAYISVLSTYVKHNGGAILTDSPVTRLLYAKDHLDGVLVEKPGDHSFTVQAKAVIITSGGFGANTALVQKYNTSWQKIDDDIATTNAPTITGDGIKLGQQAHADVTGMGFIQMMPVSDPETGELFSGIQCPPANFLMVNQQGKRFVNEYAERDVLAKAAFDNGGLFYLIADSEIKKKAYNTSEKQLAQQVKDGRLFKADTLADLATQIDIDPKVLETTVATYNAYVDQGNDPDFGKNVFDLKVEKAPFYATPRKPAIHHTMGGLTIDDGAHVLDTDGHQINGLYAAGEVAGGLHAGNRLGGNSLADIFTFGPIAAKSAVNEIVDTVTSASIH